MSLLEVCVDDIAGAIASDNAGAGRIELCGGLDAGGTTPSLGTVKVVLEAMSHASVQVLVRQRSGDFVYSAVEVDAMIADIMAIRTAASSARTTVGFVLGALTAEGTVDVPTARALLEACEGHPVTFHKAFDLTVDIFDALDELIQLDVTTVLTSGGAPTVLQGAEVISELRRRAAGRIQLLAGGGVRPHNVQQVLELTGVDQVHFRPAESIKSKGHVGPMTPLYDSGTRDVTSAGMILQMLEALGRGTQTS
ncbi:copper homeostasis protein CutC [Arthrobacter oryzae]|uniref:copper homeostasis protein CutC n=1 Tax=Arthrobacter oryzae TaxID=409290 RepID=UPI0028545992|nr:copper homeostasis protein CutC [Arthrobacter oryzae]MDR6507659.1 copper homeostasis protein [Arthrobacter oryzae]